MIEINGQGTHYSIISVTVLNYYLFLWVFKLCFPNSVCYTETNGRTNRIINRKDVERSSHPLS